MKGGFKQSGSGDSPEPEPDGVHFPKTRWSLVRRVAAASEQTRERALSDLCEAYWPPLYAWIRYRGYSSEDARDHVQSFFLHLLDSDGINRADESKGRFRSYLLGALRNFLENERTRSQALKRGGNERHISFEEAEANDFYGKYVEWVAEENDPLEAFDRAWALNILRKAEQQIRLDFERRGKKAHFEEMFPFLDTAYERIGYAGPAKNLGMTEGTFRVALHRFRKRFRAIVSDLVQDTVSSDADFEEEMETLRKSLRSRG